MKDNTITISFKTTWKLVNILDEYVERFKLRNRSELILHAIYYFLQQDKEVSELYKQFALIKKRELIGSLFDEIIKDRLRWEFYSEDVSRVFDKLNQKKATQEKKLSVCVAILNKIEFSSEEKDKKKLKEQTKKLIKEKFTANFLKKVLEEQKKSLAEFKKNDKKLLLSSRR